MPSGTHTHTQQASDIVSLHSTIHTAKEAFEAVSMADGKPVPDIVLKQAECIIVIPGMLKAAFMAGLNHGFGIASCRVDRFWSEVSFVYLTGASFGLQLGAEQTDVVLVMLNAQSKQRLLSGQLTLGVNVGITAGPDGESIANQTNSDMDTILVYTQSQGAFAGLSLAGGVLRPDDTSNQVYYGKGITTEKILLDFPEHYPGIRTDDFLEKLRSIK